MPRTVSRLLIPVRASGRSLLLLISLLGLLSGTLLGAIRTLSVNKHTSRIEFLVKATLDSFNGSLADFQPILEVDTDTGLIIGASFIFRVADIKTGKLERDRDMLKWAEEHAYPQGIFKMMNIAPATVAGRHTAKGTFIFHGIGRRFEFPVSITTDQHLYAFDGDAVIDTREFGLPIIRKFGILKVDPIVRVRFHVQGTLPGEQ